MNIEEAYRIIEDIGKTGGLDENMLDNLKKLKDALDEREGMLNKDDYETVLKERDELIIERDKLRKEKDEIVDKYIKRFMYGDNEKETNFEEVKEETEEDVKRDGTEQAFSELFERREG